MTLKPYEETVNETAILLFQTRAMTGKKHDAMLQVAEECYKDAMDFADAGVAAGFVQPEARRGRK